MEDAIKNFPKQFEWEPQIRGGMPAGKAGKLEVGSWKRFIVGAMGGSALAADILRFSDPYLNLIVHRDYGLHVSIRDRLLVACSYSGNTEEVLDFYEKARNKNLPIVAISIGGRLLELARQHNVPYIQVPDTGIQPRMATGFMIKALLKIMGEEEKLIEVGKLAETLDVEAARQEGEILSKYLRGKLPIIYSSNRNFPVAYNWKIKFNETAKIPAFANVFPELNHNEMNGFSAKSGPALGKDNSNFYFIFLEDESDSPRIQKRMKVTKKMLEDRGFSISHIPLHASNNIFHKIFQNLLIADWAAFYLAHYYGADSEQVPMIEEFKKLIA